MLSLDIPSPTKSGEVSTPWRLSIASRAASYFEILDTREFVVAAGLAALAILLRIVNITHSAFNSDEPQHLHVVWAWTRGFVQYRDVFDNHMPLFQIMCAPILALIGDRATALFWMRFAMLPLYVIAAWCTYRIGTLLFSRRVGLWAMILVGIYPTYHFTSLEFRTDNLWALFWLLCVVVILERPLTVRTSLLAGFLLGFAFGVSAKTTLLLLSTFVGAPIAIFFVGRKSLELSWRRLAGCAGTFVMGTALVPAIIIAAFALAGAWPDFRYCVFDHNILPYFWDRPWWYVAIFPLLFPLVIWAGHILVRRTAEPLLAYRRVFIFVTCGFYLTALCSFWSLITNQDFLPPLPLTAVFCAAGLLMTGEQLAEKPFPFNRVVRRIPLVAIVAAAELIVVFAIRPFWLNGAKREIDLLTGVLELTEPGDYVFDTKGEMVFRQRCFRPVLEGLTSERIRRGLMIDNISERCVATGTCVALMPRQTWLPSYQFIESNYLPVRNGLRVAGGFLKPESENPNQLDFKVVIPARYEIISREGPATGTLDGAPYNAARLLSPGRHTFESKSTAHELAFVWAQAVDRHFVPVFP